MPDEPADPDLSTPTSPSEGEPAEPGESADPLTAPGSTPGDEVHEAMVQDATDAPGEGTRPDQRPR